MGDTGSGLSIDCPVGGAPDEHVCGLRRWGFTAHLLAFVSSGHDVAAHSPMRDPYAALLAPPTAPTWYVVASSDLPSDLGMYVGTDAQTAG